LVVYRYNLQKQQRNTEVLTTQLLRGGGLIGMLNFLR